MVSWPGCSASQRDSDANMPVASPAQTIDELIEKAAGALRRKRFFESERLASKALGLARQEGDFARMARIVPSLRDARWGRYTQALDLGTLAIIAEPFPEQIEVKPGCYLVQPPLVGADARRLRLTALGAEVPAAVLCREPITAMKRCPVVAISSGATVRVRIDPPADLENPDLEWFAEAMVALGDAAIESIDPEQEIDRRIDGLLARLDAVPEHDELHQCLLEACREAEKAPGKAES